MLQKKTATKNKFIKPVKKLQRILNGDNLSKYNSVKNELGVIYDHIIGIRIRSKCNRYEHSEKSNKKTC